MPPPEKVPEEDRKKCAAVTCAQEISEALSREFGTYDVKIVHVPTNRLRQKLVRVKDAIEKSRVPGVVYEITCKDCDASYIGETANFKRIQEHQNDVKKCNAS